MYGSPYQSTLLCFREILQKEGIGAFYRSYTTQLTMNIPFQSIQFMVYECMQDLLNRDRSYDPKSHIIAGAAAGSVAACITMPLDVCKTLLNTQEHCTRTHLTYISGMASAFKTVYEFCGITGFFRGLSARVIYQMPSTAISWSVYEFFKYVIHQQRQQMHEDRYLSPNMHIAAATTRWVATAVSCTESYCVTLNMLRTEEIYFSAQLQNLYYSQLVAIHIYYRPIALCGWCRKYNTSTFTSKELFMVPNLCWVSLRSCVNFLFSSMWTETHNHQVSRQVCYAIISVK